VSIRVLLVDDHALMRQGLRAILEGERDMQVVGEAGDGRAALKLVEELAPDLVVMDVGMRELNGIDATRQILASHPGVRVIALSTHSNRHYVLGMLEAGASGYVLKISTYDELRRAVRAVARGETYLSPRVCAQLTPAGTAPLERQRPKPSALGAREREVLQLIAEGHSSNEIAKRLHISPNTVETHRRNIMLKLELHSVVELTRYALREGLSPLDD
jgi:two-component system NarL family response regulator